MEAINICPNCGKKSLIKTSKAEVKKEEKKYPNYTSHLVEVVKKYSFDCFNKECEYSSGIIGGDNLEDKIKKWWKSIMSYNI
jgi:hypothetical protein